MIVNIKFNMYSTVEKVEMVKWFYMGNSSREVSALFGVKYPNRPIPNSVTIARIIQKFEAKGTVLNNCKCNDNVRNLQENEENDNAFYVLASVAENPNISLRQIAKNVNLHHSRVLRILKKHKFRSYKYQLHQELRDTERRSAFCFQMMEKCNEDRAFVKNIIFMDEATFTQNNEPNLQNCRIWARENPRNVLHTRTQYPQKINVWVGLLGHHIIGPFFLQENLTGGRFLQLLQEEIAPAVTEVTREDQEIWFQMDGCPAHNSQCARIFK